MTRAIIGIAILISFVMTVAAVLTRDDPLSSRPKTTVITTQMIEPASIVPGFGQTTGKPKPRNPDSDPIDVNGQ